MTNPDNIVRVRARNGGRASVYEANGWAQAYTSGLIEGNGVKQNTSADMNVLVGGSAAKPDVILAENPSGYKIALDLVGQQAVTVTAPASNKRISAIVAYTDDLSLSTTQDTVTGSPASCGLIVVNGTTSVSPSAPTDNQIRTAITADGATGSQAAYCVIATIEVANDTTIITDSLIAMNQAGVRSQNIDFATIVEVVGITTGNNQNYAIKYADGTLVACIRKTFSGISFVSWGSIYEHEFSDSWLGNWAVPFVEKPVVSYSCEGGGYGYWVASVPGSMTSTTKPCAVDLCRANDASNANGAITVMAIGRWK